MKTSEKIWRTSRSSAVRLKKYYIMLRCKLFRVKFKGKDTLCALEETKKLKLSSIMVLS